MNQFKTAFLMSFWSYILDCIDAVSKRLQAEDAELSLVIDLFKYLMSYLESSRQTFKSHEQKAFELLGGV